MSTANVHCVIYKNFKQLTNNILIILIQLLMRLNPYIGRPLRCQTPELFLGIFGVLIDTDLVNIVINGIFTVLENITDTWEQSEVLVPVICIAIILITGKSVRIDGRA